MQRELGQLSLADGPGRRRRGTQPAAGADRGAGRLGGVRAAPLRGLCRTGRAAHRADPGAGRAHLRDPEALVRLSPRALPLPDQQRPPAATARRRPEPAPRPGADRLRADSAPTLPPRSHDRQPATRSPSAPPASRYLPVASQPRNELLNNSNLSRTSGTHSYGVLHSVGPASGENRNLRSTSENQTNPRDYAFSMV
jgi:hypothetical protein